MQGTVEQPTFKAYRELLGGKLMELQAQKESRHMYTPTQVSDFILDLWLALDADEGIEKPTNKDDQEDITPLQDKEPCIAE